MPIVYHLHHESWFFFFHDFSVFVINVQGNILKGKDHPKLDYEQKILQGIAETRTVMKKHWSNISKHAKNLWTKLTKGSSAVKSKKTDLWVCNSNFFERKKPDLFDFMLDKKVYVHSLREITPSVSGYFISPLLMSSLGLGKSYG